MRSFPCFVFSLLCVVLAGCGLSQRLNPLAPGDAAGAAQTQRTVAELPPPTLSAEEEAEVDGLVLPVPEAWKGDFDGMRERRLVRVLVPYSKTFYSVDRGNQDGISFALGKALEDWLNKHHPYERKSMRWRVMFIPVTRDQLLPKLMAGEGDIAAGGLTITSGRQQSVDFAEPFITGIREAVVTGPASKPITSLEGLSGYEVAVRPSSSYYEHLQALNQRFAAQGLAPVHILKMDENLESEDLLEMVNAGLLNAVVVDRYIAQLWQPLYTRLQINDDFYVHEGSEFAWALRKHSPLFKRELDRFALEHRVGTRFGNNLRRSYITHGSRRLRNATAEAEMRRFEELVQFFQKHADTYEFDYLMLMAQGYQESRLNQSARSPRGAVGIMQLLPSTASDVGVVGVESSADRNIEAASRYMRLLNSRYLDDPNLTPMDRTLLSFAAYNAGPGNLRKFRRLAEKSGLDPNVWFHNVEHSAARVVGRETVDYVANIYKYYIAYKLVEHRRERRNQISADYRARN